MDYPNIYSLFRNRVEQFRGQQVFYTRQDDQWVGSTWDQFDEDVHNFASALIASGLTPQRSVCILMKTVPEWPVADLGTIAAGGISVGLYPTNSAEQCQYIINHSDAEFVLVDTRGQLEKVLSVRDQLPHVKAIICLSESAAQAHAGVISYRTFLEFGKSRRLETAGELETRAEGATADDTAIMVYTSGTTGLPKGACLSHRYILHSAKSLEGSIPIQSDDTSFSYLPYCHVAERISGLYNRLNAGAAAYFVDDLTKLWDYMLEVKPTVFGSLPRFFEKIYARILGDVHKLPPEEQARFQQAREVGKQVSQFRQRGESVPADLQAQYDELVEPFAQKIKSYFGGRIRIATSGGAPLPQEIAEFFSGFGLPLLQAYGLTENICVAFNRPERYKFGTVGPAMEGCEIRIADDGEILVRSQMQFSGYYKQPEETADVLRDGWVYTGDLGEVDDEGFLKITGRKKELIVTSTGKKVPPALLENLLKENHLISQAMAYGDNKSFIVALITLNQIETEEYAHSKGLEYSSFAELTRHPEIVALVKGIVEGVNARVSSTEAIKKFAILDHDLSIEADEITPTLKVKRKVVSERYRDILEGLYQ